MNKQISLLILIGLVCVIKQPFDNESQVIQNVHDCISSEFSYEFNWYAKGIDKTIKERKGDCTDYAMLANKIFYNVNIKSEIVHGYAKCGNIVKHDWLLVNGNVFDTLDCSNYELYGNRVW